MNEQQVRDQIAAHEEFIGYVTEIFERYIRFTEGSSHLNEGTVHFCDDEVCGEGDEYWRYGGHEHHYYSMPITMLWDTDAKFAQLEQDRIDRKAREEAAKVAEAEAKRFKAEQDRRAQYERLKAEFEGGVK